MKLFICYTTYSAFKPRYSGGGGDGDTMHFEDSASAAAAAAEAAKKAITAAEAAAYLAQKDPGQVRESLGYSNNATRYNMKHEYESPSKNTREMGDNSEVLHHEYKSQSVGRSHYSSNEDSISTNMDDPRKVNRRHSYNVPSARGDIKFDESDCDEEIEMEEPDGTFLPPNRPAPQVPPAHVKQNPAPRVHPKLPDYDTLAARFEALKYRKSQT